MLLIHPLLSTFLIKLLQGVGQVDHLAHSENTVFQFKGSFEDQKLTKYESLRVKLHAPYTI